MEMLVGRKEYYVNNRSTAGKKEKQANNADTAGNQYIKIDDDDRYLSNNDARKED